METKNVLKLDTSTLGLFMHSVMSQVSSVLSKPKKIKSNRCSPEELLFVHQQVQKLAREKRVATIFGTENFRKLHRSIEVHEIIDFYLPMCLNHNHSPPVGV